MAAIKQQRQQQQQAATARAVQAASQSYGSHVAATASIPTSMSSASAPSMTSAPAPPTSTFATSAAGLPSASLSLADDQFGWGSQSAADYSISDDSFFPGQSSSSTAGGGGTAGLGTGSADKGMNGGPAWGMDDDYDAFGKRGSNASAMGGGNGDAADGGLDWSEFLTNV